MEDAKGNNRKGEDRGDVGWYASIALDSSEYPHISYFDGNNFDLKYAGWTPGEEKKLK